MANKKLVQLPEMGLPTTGDALYMVQSLQSFQTKLDRISQTLISQYNVLTNNLPAGLMTSGNAEIILQGLNNAVNAKINQDRLNVDWPSIMSGYFDVDGGSFYDTFVNASTFDGGTF